MTNYSISGSDARKLRWQGQNLYSRDSSGLIEQVLNDIFAVQAQDLSAAYLSLRARGSGFTAAEVSRERQHGTAIFWGWSLRGTLHLITVRDARWLLPILGPGIAARDRRRLYDLGFTDETAARAVDAILQGIRISGQLSRAQITQILADNHLPFSGQAPTHAIYKAYWESGLASGSDLGKKPTYTTFQSRFGAFTSRPDMDGLIELANRYLAAYAPARPEDFAAWSGVKIGKARAAWQLMVPNLIRVEFEGVENWILPEQLPLMEHLSRQDSVLRLLPRFDTYLLGYTTRGQLIDPEYEHILYKGGGTIDATIVVDGWIIGTWRSQPKRGGLEITATLFEPLSDHCLSQVEEETRDIGRFLEKPVTLKVNTA